ncbi:alpha/beta hydrolase fold [Methanoregula boonei 6A8]|uniref:Alpha/beta hydrolase fold n=1 Tax=Methanoregula boonei (strain DSM 21154 / JCM 14090 / 6A8) TaxID=456442 RepID=A7I6I4_METB6|nr:alpha/beta hydrolase [Methanoregula boonei]ABS55345.1 alpha/beta hydrolase fold [Methanoregula boonei 6A8]
MSSPVRKWGAGPYSVAVIHGGPGAPGEMAPVARELSTVKGILEPFQTETTLEGQVRELRSVLERDARLPVTLVGFSWGAYLSWMVAARYPALVGKVILVGSPPFDDQYAAAITRTRLERLNPGDRKEVQEIQAQMEDPGPGTGGPDRNVLLARMGDLISRADSFAPQANDEKSFACQYEVYRGVWDEACELRRKKGLLHMAREITCPVLAIHGDYDPHPAEGVEVPLEKELKNFRFVLLPKCGHRPWVERNAAEEFYRILTGEI